MPIQLKLVGTFLPDAWEPQRPLVSSTKSERIGCYLKPSFGYLTTKGTQHKFGVMAGFEHSAAKGH